MSALPPEMDSLKNRLKATWMAGDYGYFATFLEPGALEFLDRLGVRAGMRVVDVGCGAGQIAIPMARAGVDVTGVDIATNLIEQARARADDEGLEVRFDEGDAELLPYPDASFDLVVSLIGAMFAPRPQRVAAELVRVCKRGGRIVMANWTPQGFIGQMFAALKPYAPSPPAGAQPPPRWGDEDYARSLLGDRVTGLTERRQAVTVDRFDRVVSEAILYHHERFDGTGYPLGLRGNAIPLLARIVLIADAFDAITSHRSYQPALPVEYAVEEINRYAGTQFDPDLAQVFTQLVSSDRLGLRLGFRAVAAG